MRADIIHVTNHAFERWIERASENGFSTDEEILEVVKKSTVVKKNQQIPYGTKRLPNMVYSVFEDCLFVLEPVSIGEYRLITIINENVFVHKHHLESAKKKARMA